MGIFYQPLPHFNIVVTNVVVLYQRIYLRCSSISVMAKCSMWKPTNLFPVEINGLVPTCYRILLDEIFEEPVNVS